MGLLIHEQIYVSLAERFKLVRYYRKPPSGGWGEGPTLIKIPCPVISPFLECVSRVIDILNRCCFKRYVEWYRSAYNVPRSVGELKWLDKWISDYEFGLFCKRFGTPELMAKNWPPEWGPAPEL